MSVQPENAAALQRLPDEGEAEVAVNISMRLDRERVRMLTERERAMLVRRTRESGEMYRRARQSLSGGVASHYHARDPWPIYLATGEGATVYDVDDNRMWDFHLGFGSMVQGHAHAAIVEAVQKRARLGTHFAATTEEVVWVAEELNRRWGLDRWAFVNSGSEATMGAIRIARAYTGRDTILKMLGSYHGHHDGVMISVGVSRDKIGDRESYPSIPYGAGIPEGVLQLTVAVPFNDAEAMERRIHRLNAEGRKPACVIMEAAMMNLGVILPAPGYLENVREITRHHGIVLIFDEVKTGLTLAAGGATERFGIKPDIVTLAKSLGGGLPAGAIGGTHEVMSVVEGGDVYHVGTYNGNPLCMAAARASLSTVLTPQAYEHLNSLNDYILARCQEVIDRSNLPAYTVGVGAKGCVMFSRVPVTDYESFMANQDGDVAELAWLYNMNRGILMAPGREEEWTLSVMHTREAADAYVGVFEEIAGDLTA